MNELVNPPIHSYIHLATHPSSHQPIHTSTHIHPPSNPSIHPPPHPSIPPPTDPSIYSVFRGSLPPNECVYKTSTFRVIMYCHPGDACKCVIEGYTIQRDYN